jgi:hypothetical protein
MWQTIISNDLEAVRPLASALQHAGVHGAPIAGLRLCWQLRRWRCWRF